MFEAKTYFSLTFGRSYCRRNKHAIMYMYMVSSRLVGLHDVTKTRFYSRHLEPTAPLDLSDPTQLAPSAQTRAINNASSAQPRPICEMNVQHNKKKTCTKLASGATYTSNDRNVLLRGSKRWEWLVGRAAADRWQLWRGRCRQS